MGERRRVLWLVKGLGPGGAERLLLSFARTTTASDVDYSCAYLREDRSHLVGDLRAAGVPVHLLRGRAWPWRLRQLLARERYDIVHLHSPLVAAVARLVMRTLPKAGRPKVVSTEHNVPEAYHPLTKLLNDLTFGLDDAHLAVSEGAVRSAPARHRDEVEVVVHGVALAEVRAASDRDGVRAELGLPTDALVVGTVANYRSQKAWPDLLAAARMVLDACPGVRFVGVGQGPLQAEVEAAHDELRLGEGFQLLGYRADAARIVSACDIFYLASVQEGLPVAVMEALALGVPVVATDVGGLPEAITDGVDGLLVRPGRPRELADAIIALVEDRDRRSRVAEGARRRGESFGMSRAVERIESLYRELVPTP